MFLLLLLDLLGILGVVGVFVNNLTFIIVGASAFVLENIIGSFLGIDNNKFALVFVAGLIGLIVYLIIGQPFWIGILAGLCFLSALVSIATLCAMIFGKSSN